MDEIASWREIILCAGGSLLWLWLLNVTHEPGREFYEATAFFLGLPVIGFLVSLGS